MLNVFGEFLKQNNNLLLCMVGLPVVVSFLLWIFRKQTILLASTAIAAAFANLVFAISLYTSTEFYAKLPFTAFGFEFSLRSYAFSSFFLALTGFMFFLIAIYTVSNLSRVPYQGLYSFYLYLSLAMINGAILSDNLGIMLFFWEGLLCTLFGILLINNQEHPGTAVKALTLSGTADLLLMLGIIITTYLAGTGNLSEINRLPIQGMGILGFLCLMFGAIGKAGSMPFHSWIPNASDDAPTVFMVTFPAVLEKTLGIYFAARIVLGVYDFVPGGLMSIIIMTVATLTIVFAVAMALIQKDMKRLLSYHAISQLGYMVLGIGSGLPVGIIGGLFHLINNALYKTGLFMIAGSIEKQTNTTDLHLLGGLRKKMPLMAICFLVFAFSIAGFPGSNGFFSKELIFDAALEIHPVFYFGALLGALMTALSFLKIGRSLFFGKLKLPKEIHDVKDTTPGMLIPIGILAVLCLVFGVANTFPLDQLLGPVLDFEESFSGWPHSELLVAISAGVLLLAAVDHIYGAKKTGSALSAADHIHYAPGLKNIYHWAEKGYFDPYNWLTKFTAGFSFICVKIENGVSWVYDIGIPGVFLGVGNALHRFDNGSLPRYLTLAIVGLAFITLLFIISLPI